MSERVAILGGGESGIGAAWLANARGLEVFLSDAGNISQERKDALMAQGIDFEEGGHTDKLILNADWVVKSPGIPDTAPLIQKILNNGVPVISEIEFGYKYLPEKAKVIAITGTNGKTTTTLLTHHILSKAGFNVGLAGNIGTSLAGLVAQGTHDYYVIEVSSFQLDGIQKFRPDVAVLLNITPDHLDRYEYDFKKYVYSKFRILENLTSEECFIYCKDSQPITEELALRKVEACMFAVSASEDSKVEAYMEKSHLIFNYQFKERSGRHHIPLSDIALIGKHNMVNIMAAVLSALCVGASIEKTLKGLKTFKNAPHRLELVGVIRGVGFINDSKATNVDAAYYALDGVKSGIVWIVGGVDKGNDYSQLLPLVKDKVKAIICLGVDNQIIHDAFGGLEIPIIETKDVNNCVRESLEFATEGDSVLLSPACASFDLFKNYEDRGDQFREAVKSLKKNSKAKL